MAGSERANAPEKIIDLPPTGLGNEDPLSGEAGAHPMEAGLGSALGAAATGLIMGVAVGPVGAVAGAILGGVAGGYAGKGIGESYDPTDPALLLTDEDDADETPPRDHHAGPHNSLGATFGEIEHESPTGFLTEPTLPPPD